MTDTRKDALKKWWCNLTHGGGHINRDDTGRLNWRCVKCRRWHDRQITRAEERRMSNRALAARYHDVDAAP